MLSEVLGPVQVRDKSQQVSTACWGVQSFSAPCYSKQLELRAANGSVAAIGFPLLVSLVSGSFTFCKVVSLLPCPD